jgi:hypothetical protein
MMVHNWAFTSDIWTILMAVGAELRLLDINGNFQNVPLYGFEKVRSTRTTAHAQTHTHHRTHPRTRRRR